ncbi:DUF2130 domain-containing protein [Geoglobus acetivorans]|uniref:DUF2130 domain-containing protein n=1 Tax=Geoglobus acetivorans TaxID=565033 RepID=A0ABZ3H096_GEOAI|nr:DUF2130 domain-containing protein [Geoglobus acetivorans]
MSGITLGDDRETVYIQCEIKSRELFEVLQDIEDDKRLEVFVDIVKIGVTGYRRMNIGVDLDFVEKKIEEMLSKLEETLDPHLETSLLGVFMSRVKEYFDRGGKIEDILDPETENTPLGKFVRSLKEYFDSGGKLESLLNPDSETSPIGRFSKKLEEYLGRGGRLEELLNPAEDDSPLGKLKKEILREIKEIRDILSKEEGRKEVVDATTLKGYVFEDACEEILSGCVGFGESIIRTTDEVGKIPRSKKGDFVVELENGKKVVFEVKDWQNVSLNKIKDEVSEAIENRGADYGVFVSKYIEALPKSVGWFNEYGNILVCALGSREADTFHPEMLHVAYQWAKMKLKAEGDADREAINRVMSELDKLNDELYNLSEIKKKCRSAKKAIDDVEKIANSLEESLEESLDSLKKALGAVAG